MATINSVVLISGTIYQIVGVGVPVSGTSGTMVGTAGPGSVYFDSATGRRYVNSYLVSSPIWDLTAPTTGITENLLTSAALSGLGVVRYAKAVYDFAADGGTIGVITPVSGATLPINTIVMGGIIDGITIPVSGGAATLSIGTSAGSSATSIKGVTAYGTYTGLIAVVPLFTAATMFKMTAAGNIIFTLAGAALTAGKIDVTLAYVVAAG